ncbi:MAG: hypothetical protein QXZ06_08965, partial [Candidatus Jordarchaeales archaeon]
MSIKEEFLLLLEKDKEFRYAVLGLLGLDEIIKRMDQYHQAQIKILERLENLERIQTKLAEEHVSFREALAKLSEG